MSLLGTLAALACVFVAAGSAQQAPQAAAQAPAQQARTRPAAAGASRRTRDRAGADRAAADQLAVASAPRRTDRARHRASASDSAGRRPRDSSSRGAWRFFPTARILVTERPGRLRIVRNGVLDPNAGRRHAAGAGGRSRRPDGPGAPSALRREPAGVFHLSQACGEPIRGSAGGASGARAGIQPARHDHARARALGRRGARRVEGSFLGDRVGQCVAHRVRQGRHGLHDGRLWRHARRQPGSRRRAAAGSQQPRRQSAAAARRWHGSAGQSVCRPHRLPAGDLHARAIATCSGWPCTRIPAPSGNRRTARTAATRSTSCRRARTTGGRSSASAGSIWAPASATNPGRKGWSSRWCSGCRRSRRRD